MEGELFGLVRARLRGLMERRRGCCRFSDALIVLVFFWSCLNDRPVTWACVPGNWPGRLRPRELPSQSRMSRRLRTAPVRARIDELEEKVLRAGRPAPLACALDAKPLPIGPHSHDRQARWGRGAGVRAKGYKLHMLLSLSGTVVAWRLTPMNGDEREMARRLLRDAACAGYHLGDGNFDANAVHEEAARHGGQPVAPRRNGPARGWATAARARPACAASTSWRTASVGSGASCTP